jgi:hypothetical protein
MAGRRATKAVIYCHVASGDVGARELSLQSQETRGRAHAARRGYEVAKVFYDFPTEDPADQTALPDALVYLARHDPGSHVVIADRTYGRAPAALREAGAILESPTSDFAYEPRFRFTDGMDGAEPVVKPDRPHRRRM